MKRHIFFLVCTLFVMSCGGSKEKSTTFGWPSGASLTGDEPSVCGIALSWPEANLAAGYRVYHDDKLIEQVTTKGYFVRALPLGASVTLSVEAFNSQGDVSERISLTNTIPDTLPIFDPPVPKPGLPGQFYDKVSFLFTGDQPYQCDLEKDELKIKTISVIRGKITGRDGRPIKNVAVSIANNQKYGFSYSREDGWFDLAVNGDEDLTVHYQKDGYIPIQRKIIPEINRYDFIDDVVMIQLDHNKAVIDLQNSTEVQVARGSEVSDEDGIRQATMLFKPGTKVNLTYKDGRKVALDQITVRATEFTVGENGPAAMPGILPSASGYTYAVELSADEVLDAGAKTVTFEKPVYTYVDNFLNFPSGTIVPNGYYDYDQKKWLADHNGVVITVLSHDGGIATVDVDGDRVADEGETLTKLGFNEGELRKLATLYEAGKSLWRVPITHFSPHDFNWPYVCDGECKPPTKIKEHPCDKYYKKYYHNIIVAPAPGGSNLNYCSMNGSYEATKKGRTEVMGNGYTAKIKLIGAKMPEKLKIVIVVVEIAGKKDEYYLYENLSTNMTYKYKWDGKDKDKKVVPNQTEAVIKIGYAFGGKEREPNKDDFSFGLNGDGETFETTTRENFIKWREESVLMGADRPFNQKNNGWKIEGFHQYDPSSSYLHLGSGDSVKAVPLEAAKWKKQEHNRVSFTNSSGYIPVLFTILSDGTIATTDSLYGGFMFLLPDGTQKEYTPDLPGEFVVTKIFHDQEDRVYFSGFDMNAQNSCPAIYRIAIDGTIEHLAGDTDGIFYSEGVEDGADALKTCLQ